MRRVARILVATSAGLMFVGGLVSNNWSVAVGGFWGLVWVATWGPS